VAELLSNARATAPCQRRDGEGADLQRRIVADERVDGMDACSPETQSVGRSLGSLQSDLLPNTPDEDDPVAQVRRVEPPHRPAQAQNGVSRPVSLSLWQERQYTVHHPLLIAGDRCP
jgi:hypothetical protein